MKNLFLVTLGQFSQVGNWSRDGLATAISVVVKEENSVLLENSSTAIRVKTRVVSTPPGDPLPILKPKSYQHREHEVLFLNEIMDMFKNIFFLEESQIEKFSLIVVN